MTAVHDTDRHRATLNFYGSARTGQRLDFDTVRAAAAGRWPALLVALGIADEYLRDRHGPCPGCGGTDRFRYDDRDGAGSWLCSAGGGARASAPRRNDSAPTRWHASRPGYFGTLTAAVYRIVGPWSPWLAMAALLLALAAAGGTP